MRSSPTVRPPLPPPSGTLRLPESSARKIIPAAGEMSQNGILWPVGLVWVSPRALTPMRGGQWVGCSAACSPPRMRTGSSCPASYRCHPIPGHSWGEICLQAQLRAAPCQGKLRPLRCGGTDPCQPARRRGAALCSPQGEHASSRPGSAKMCCQAASTREASTGSVEGTSCCAGNIWGSNLQGRTAAPTFLEEQAETSRVPTEQESALKVH